MKKIIFSSLLVLSAFISNAQSPVITIGYTVNTLYIGTVLPGDYDTHDFANELMETTPSGQPEMIIDFHVENVTGDSVHWIVSRKRIGVDTSWNDYLCWGPENDPLNGQCITAGTMDQDTWVGDCSESFTMDFADGGAGDLSAHIFPNLNQSGCGTYRYFVGPCNDPYADSVDVSVCFTVGLDPLDGLDLALTISPNPATDVFQINTESNDLMSYTIVNAIGQRVDSGVFVKNQSIEASQFENGIYFVTVTDQYNATKTNKVIVNH